MNYKVHYRTLTAKQLKEKIDKHLAYSIDPILGVLIQQQHVAKHDYALSLYKKLMGAE